MTTADDRGPALEWTGERYVPQVSGNIRLEHLHRYLLARELSKGTRVLDIACGEGYGSDLLAEVAEYVVGVDIAVEVVRHARVRYRRANLAFAAGDCTAIPLADRSIDVVVSFETLEHHDRHAEMMQEVKRVLRPGGLLIISSPDRREYSEVPEYQNPYHAQELDRTEFARLLESHFSQVRLVGQRIRAGSIVGPISADESSPFISFAETDSGLTRVEGVQAPLYFIGLASDGKAPEVPAGILEGGDFLWSADHVAGVAAVKAAEENHREAVTAVLKEEIDRRGQLIDDIERSRRELQALSNTAHAALEDARRQLGSTRARLSEAHAQLEGLTARLSSLEATDRDLLRRLRQRDVQFEESRVETAAASAAIADLEGVRDALSARVALMERSHSWKVTAPLRASRRLADRTAGFSRQLISDTARATYRRLPLTARSKRAMKETLFRLAPRLVQHTVAYRDWQRQSAGTAPTPLPLRNTAADAPAGGHTAATEAEAPMRYLGDAAVEYVPLMTAQAVHTRIKAIAFYLPQFHPIPENDAWWGKGFTEWHNVTRGKPRFPGHYQPHLPGELGFYDLRLVDVQRRQVELAKAYGLHGFCYHHYWFGGQRLLRRPLEQLLANPDLDFPFCLCWANENWTRRWDGLDAEMLIAQEHSPEDDLAFIKDIEGALSDDRYVCVEGRPLLIVYRPGLLPDARDTVERWRTYRRSAGLPDLFLVSAQAFDRSNPHDFGFDAAVEFAPNNMGTASITAAVAGVDDDFSGTIYDYSDLVQRSGHYESPSDYLLFRSVTPMWDNEARRPGRGSVFAGSTPSLYGEWLENACRHTDECCGSDKPFVFINAWNEWAEGAHLEPDRAHGYAYLQATADALRKFPVDRPSIVVVSHDAYFHGAQRLALTLATTLSRSLGYDVDVLLCGGGPLTADFGQIGRVHEFSAAASTPEARQRIARDLFDRGARLALCNTSVVGDTVELLKEAGFKVVSMIHELPGLIGQYGLEASIASIARNADRVVFPARIVRDPFIDLTGMPLEKAVVRPQGLLAQNRFADDRETARRDIRTLLGLPPEATIVLAVGFADRRKGIDLFVEVGLDLLDRRPDTCFVWVGHHDADAFSAARARVAESGAGARFFFPGLVENPDAFFAGADAYLMTSREDPYPLVVLDALDARVPVIGFDGGGGFVELLKRGCGVLVPYLDTRAMADALGELLDNPSEASRLSAVGKDIITREYSFIDYARDLVHLAQGPRVSVIVPNFNYARYLPARLRSIVTQSYRPYEIIFLDDCSSDPSVDIARGILEAAAIPFRIIRNETNQGVYRQWLRGLQEATGDLVWIAEADDDCSPLLLETLVPAFVSQEVTLAYCQSRQIDAAGREIGADYLAWTEDVDATKWLQAYVRRGVDEVRDSLAVKNTIPNVSAVLMRKPDLSEIASELITLRNAGDWRVYVYLLERGDLAFFPEPLNYHRRHGGSVTIGNGGLNLMRETLLLQRHILDRHALSPDVERKREAHLQSTYEYLRLHVDGPASYKEHELLRTLTVLGG
jgi:glycosyltransferase involved in cell wall biosynthesis/SAM-dependent methyltransferase